MKPRLQFTFFTLRRIFGLGFWLAFRLKVVGRENLPPAGPFIVIGNHASFLDPFILSAHCGHPIQWLVTQEFYGKLAVRWLLWWFGTIPVGGGRSMIRSYRRIAEVLADGGVIGIFPEGGITRDGNMKEFRSGAAMIAFRMGVPIVPMYIHGSFEALSRYAKWPKFVPVTVRIGEPIDVVHKTDPLPEEIAALTARMREAVGELEVASRGSATALAVS
jgi:1-acyl-sn-glycerol-3-phosphate acyltransferase